MLYLVSTPIGNLKDITYRAVEVLKSCDYILCEDTRHSQILLQHYEIEKPLRSYHQFNEAERLHSIIRDLEKGVQIALISDGGTPGFCDPGLRLIKKCREEKLPITVLPGACAAIAALTLSGYDMDSFQFLGFFPRKDKEQKSFLQRIVSYSGVSVCYESPQRLLDTLQILSSYLDNRKIAVARELTKTFEEVVEGSPLELVDHFTKNPPKGEIVLLIEGAKEDASFLQISAKELLKDLQETYGLSLTEAIKTAAHLRKEPKQTIYKAVHQEESFS